MKITGKITEGKRGKFEKVVSQVFWRNIRNMKKEKWRNNYWKKNLKRWPVEYFGEM